MKKLFFLLCVSTIGFMFSGLLYGQQTSSTFTEPVLAVEKSSVKSTGKVVPANNLQLTLSPAIIPWYYNITTRESVGDGGGYDIYYMDRRLLKTACDYGKCVDDKSYSKIRFKSDSGQYMYAKGAISIKKNYLSFIGPVSVFFEDNNQLFFQGDIAENKFKEAKQTFYYKNGKLRREYLPYRTTANWKQDFNVKDYAPDGSLNFDINIHDKSFTHLPNKYLYNLSFSSQRAPVPKVIPERETVPDGFMLDDYKEALNFIRHSNGGFYTGYKAIGSYKSPEGNTMSGFLYSSIPANGNGSVVYVQPADSNVKPYYTIYFDGKLDKRYKMQVDAINPNDFVENLNKNIIFTKSEKIEIYRNKNLETLTGYGVNYKDTTIDKYNIRTMDIGIFKNGKLDGLGYRLKYKTSGVDSYYEEVSYQYGFFKSGQFTKGESHKATGLPYADNWHPNQDARFSFAQREGPANVIMSDYKYKASSYYEERNMLMYVPKIKRVFNWKGYDKTTKKVTLISSYLNGHTQKWEKDSVRLSAEDDIYFMLEVNDKYIMVDCKDCAKGIVTFKGERSVPVVGYDFYGRGYIGSDGKVYHYELRKGTYYETCTSCNGTGLKRRTNEEKFYELMKIE